MLGLENHPHATLAEFVEDDVVAQRQRCPVADVDLLGLKSGEVLLYHQLLGQHLAVRDRSAGDQVINQLTSLLFRHQAR